MTIVEPFDSTKYIFASVCLRGHKWQDTNKSLRYKSNRNCVQCCKNEAPKTVEQRFWAKVSKSDNCWEWVGSKNLSGYGQFMFKGKLRTTHRVVWQLTYGDIPDGMFICHKCDNRKCVRPEHLFLGTHLDNLADMYAKNRRPAAKGTKNGNSKLSENQVRQIREMYVPHKVTQREIAELFGISLSQVKQILHRKDWTHI